MDIEQVSGQFKGRFITDPHMLASRLAGIRAFVFDWDGVFNAGWKDADNTSPFNEVDAMGTNLLRFNFHLRTGHPPVTAVISGEHNKAAISLARREHFNAVYSGIKYKAVALDHLASAYGIRDEEVAFFFDDVLDFSIAARCGIRIMVKRDCNPLLIDWAERQGYIDYLTAADGAHHAVREAVELLTGLSGRYDDTMSERARFTDRYQEYLQQRNQATPQFYTVKDAQIIEL